MVYDKTFGKIFFDRIRQVIESLNIPPGAQVLELGVGTGTSFPAYPRHCEVTGIDLAVDMLGQARAKIAKNTWFHLQVMEMDALNLILRITVLTMSRHFIPSRSFLTLFECWLRPTVFAVPEAKS